MISKKISVILVAFLLVSLALPLTVSAKSDERELTIYELKAYGKPDKNPIPSTDNAGTNPDYALLRTHWYTTANYLINPSSNTYGFTSSQVETVVKAAANTWDIETNAAVFNYAGTTTTLRAGVGDGYNVVDWGTYQSGVIAVAYVWSIGRQIVETDLRMNTNIIINNVVVGWSISGENNKFDVQNILTHEFGHWAGLKDLYTNADYWLTMYGYGWYGETHKQTLGLGDIKGLEAFYGP